MSRIGKNPVVIPAGVEVTINEDNLVVVKGPKGTLEKNIPQEMTLTLEDGELTVKRPSDRKQHKELHGLSRTLIYNMVIGVTEGYQKSLEISGVGYRAEKKGNKLVMNLGYSHPVEMDDPEGIETLCESATKITVKGIDKEAVGAHAANIRAHRLPEPYKGHGIRYSDEYIRRKVGKTG